MTAALIQDVTPEVREFYVTVCDGIHSPDLSEPVRVKFSSGANRDHFTLGDLVPMAGGTVNPLYIRIRDIRNPQKAFTFRSNHPESIPPGAQLAVEEGFLRLPEEWRGTP